jgi:hypothetical protein
MKYQDIDIAANVVLFHGKSPECRAQAAEYGSFSAFGGVEGNGFSYCRGGDKVKKHLHIYLFIE